jgi:hypothetical protein
LKFHLGLSILLSPSLQIASSGCSVLVESCYFTCFF